MSRPVRPSPTGRRTAVFEGSAQLAQISVEATLVAALIIPTAGPIAGDMYKGQCDPSFFYKGHEVWDGATKTLEAAAKEIEAAIAQVSDEMWSGADREAFEENLKDYKTQIEAAAFLANAVSVILLTVAWALFIYITIMAFVAAFLAALLIFIAAESAVTLGAGYGPAVAEATSLVGSLYTAFWEPVTKALEVMLNAFAAIMGGSLIADLGTQMATGNLGAGLDFVFAQAPAMDVIWRGSLNRAERKVTADMMSGGLSTETSAVPGIPKFTQMLPAGFGGAANIKAARDTAATPGGGQLFTGGLISKHNDQVG